LKAVERAATLVHFGSMATVASSHQQLFDWAEAAGEKPVGYSGETYIECDGDPDTWVTELWLNLA